MLEEISDLYVFDENQTEIENELNRLQSAVVEIVQQSKQLVSQTRDEYTKQQNFVPSDIAQELTSLEFLTERLQGTMEEKDREFKRAKTVRTEYLHAVDFVQDWLQNTEVRIQDRTLEPLQFKEVLNKIHQEIPSVKDKLDSVKQNGYVIMEKTRNINEKEIIRKTIDQLVQRFEQIRSWLEEKKNQVGDSLDAWTRFMNLYQIVMAWAAEKRTFLEIPLNVTTLPEARQKMNDYEVGIKMGWQ